MISTEDKLMQVLGNRKLEGSSIRRQMNNRLSASDTDILLDKLVNEKVLVVEYGRYSIYRDPNNPMNWEQV